MDLERLKRDARRASGAWRTRFGDAVRAARDRNRVTQAQLGALAGMDWTTISRIERGETIPDLATIETLADLLGVSIDDLIGRETPEPTLPIGVSAAPPEERRSPNPWPLLRLLQSQLDETRLALQEAGILPAEDTTKPPPKGRRTA